MTFSGASGAFGNCATRAEAFVAKGGVYAYGSYPDIDALFAEQAVQALEDEGVDVKGEGFEAPEVEVTEGGE